MLFCAGPKIAFSLAFCQLSPFSIERHYAVRIEKSNIFNRKEIGGMAIFLFNLQLTASESISNKTCVASAHETARCIDTVCIDVAAGVISQTLVDFCSKLKREKEKQTRKIYKQFISSQQIAKV
jgi:hypothetical protein